MEMESVWIIVAIGAALALMGMGVRLILLRLEKRRRIRKSSEGILDTRSRP
jgi:hypothetical protein